MHSAYENYVKKKTKLPQRPRIPRRENTELAKKQRCNGDDF